MKSFIFIFFFFIFSFFSISDLIIRFNFGFIYFNIKFLDNFFFSFKFDIITLKFFLIVFLVTSLVLLYREIYIEHYSNFKFLTIVTIFLSSIIILSMSSSALLLIVGWDFLGVSSILLIIFYLNKTGLYNSILTMFFNRVGDLILIICLSIWYNNSNLYCCFLSDLRIPLCIFLIVCSFTKRAQFPFSSWLPAAMSAPTPISAIVHSSTLVTAGIFLFILFKSNLLVNNWMSFFFFFPALTFLLGGFIANLELDFKKIIAFSTLRQVSLIYFFCFYLDIYFGISHIFFHALFKSSLFCFSGFIFISSYSNQNFLNLTIFKNDFLKLFFILSLFSISGFLFSSSFFRKDLCLEILLRRDYIFIFTFIFLGRVLTVIYTSKIFLISRRFPFKNFYYSDKFIFSYFFVFYRICIIISFLNFNFFDLSVFCCVNILELSILTFVILLSILFSLKSNRFLMILVLNIIFIKDISFSFFKNIFNQFSHSLFKDDFFFRPNFYANRTFLINFFTLKNWFYFSLLILFIIFLYFFSLLERGIEDTKDLK